VWLDPTTADGVSVLHMLRHTSRNTSGTQNQGRHYHSTTNGREWLSAPSGELAYDCTMTYPDGSSECLIMRERPHLVMAPQRDPASGRLVPVALTTGAMRGPYTAPQRNHARSFTLLQKIGQEQTPPA
jgi:hypothetical protein